MSEFFEGPGYWMASDGKWYRPDQHPDPSYRDRFNPAESPEPAAQEQVDAAAPATPDDHNVAVGEVATGEFPTVELGPEETVSSDSSGLSYIHNTVEPAVEDSLPSERREAEASSTTSPSAFSVKSTPFGAAPERPVFEVSTPRSVVAAPDGTTSATRESSGGRLELEIDRVSADSSAPGSYEQSTPPSRRFSSSTALAVIPPVVATGPDITLFDRLVAALVFSAGVAMIVGTFLNWTTGSLEQTGWDRGDGIATIIAGVVGSAAAGPIYVGYHHILPKAIAIVSGLVGLVVVGLTAISVLTDSASADTSLGVGFIVVALGAAAMTIGGIADRGELIY